MESDRMVTFFSKERGKIDLILKGIRRSRSRFGSMAEPFTETHIFFYRKTANSLGIVQQAEILCPHDSLRMDYRKIIFLGYIAHLLDRLIGKEKRDAGIYRLIHHFLTALEKGQDPEKTIMIFEWRLFSQEGYRPDMSQCQDCRKKLRLPCRFEYRHARGFYGHCCGRNHERNSVPVTEGAFRFLLETLSAPIEETLRFRLNPSTRNSLRPILRKMVTYHLPEIRYARSRYEKELQEP